MASYYYFIWIVITCNFLKAKEVFCHTDLENNIKNLDTLNDFLNVAGNIIRTAKEFASIRSSTNSLHPTDYPMDCAEIYSNNVSSRSGLYTIWPRSRVVKCPISVYCDMDDDGGAWTVIQRRGDFDSPKDYFFRDWNSYKNGFGDLSKDFWLGNDNIYALTNERANLLKFSLSDWEGNVTHATYDDFWIEDETNNYKMHISVYRGTAGDSMSYANGHPFTTKDKDNDKHANNCAEMFKGAWWYVSCHASNLNGYYLKGAHESYADGVEWSSFRGQHYSLKDAVIKIRPKDFINNNYDITPQ